MAQIRLLVVDDSLLMQRVLTDILQSDPQIKVVGTARNGEDALEKIATLHPDVVTMDVEMPIMDGLTAVQKIMEINPVPVVMVSALTQEEALLTLKALEFGAVDYVPKPSGSISLNMDVLRDELISKVKTAAIANISRVIRRIQENISKVALHTDKVISIAASTGGPPAVAHVLRALPVDSPPILIVQHMPKGVTGFFAKGLSEKCNIKVKEAEEGDRVQNGLALVAPGGSHMVVNRDKRVSLTSEPPVNYVRPSADVLMFSLAEVYGAKNIAVVLTGMGSDGAKGIKAIKENRGFTIAQDEKTSVVFGMPKVAFETGCVDVVAPLEQISNLIINASIKPYL